MGCWNTGMMCKITAKFRTSFLSSFEPFKLNIPLLHSSIIPIMIKENKSPLCLSNIISNFYPNLLKYVPIIIDLWYGGMVYEV